MRTYILTVNDPTVTFTTTHQRPSWAFKYADLYRSTWPKARITLKAVTL